MYQNVTVRNDGCSSCLWTVFKVIALLVFIGLCSTVFLGYAYG